MKKLLVFILIFMLAFTGCDKFHKIINELQNEAELKEVLNDKTDVKEVVKAEHHHTVAHTNVCPELFPNNLGETGDDL